MVSYNPESLIVGFSHKWDQERARGLVEESPRTHTSMKPSLEEREARSHPLLLLTQEAVLLSSLWMSLETLDQKLRKITKTMLSLFRRTI